MLKSFIRTTSSLEATPGSFTQGAFPGKTFPLPVINKLSGISNPLLNWSCGELQHHYLDLEGSRFHALLGIWRRLGDPALGWSSNSMAYIISSKNEGKPYSLRTKFQCLILSGEKAYESSMGTIPKLPLHLWMTSTHTIIPSHSSICFLAPFPMSGGCAF